MMPRALATSVSHAFAALALAALAGCSSSDSAGGASVAEHSTVATPYTPNMPATEASPSVADASAAAASHQGSPLCNASHFAGPCYPDDPATARSCGPSPDGGAYDLRATLACHVTPVAADAAAATLRATVEPVCSVPGLGGKGAACDAPSDCSTANECVGAGTCRHYCCAGDTACQADEFCDTQPLAQAPRIKVPVCTPIRPCALFDEGDGGACQTGETCAVVRDENGATGCVPVGSARDGESCETAYCARGLTCIGAWAGRTCYTLCHTAAPVECSSGQACKGNLTLFPNPAFGVCEP